MVLIYFFTKMGSTNYTYVNYLLRDLYHANLIHLISNMLSFYFLSPLEDIMGHGRYLFSIIFIWILSTTIFYFYQKTTGQMDKITVGFSGVIFGLFVVYLSYLGRGASKYNIGILIAILAPQFFMPGISVSGHICGMIAGFIYVALFENGRIRNFRKTNGLLTNE